jgi:hypothetical protein
VDTARGSSFAADQDEGPQRGFGRPIPPLVSKIQVATTNAGARAQGGLTPDFLALSYWPPAIRPPSLKPYEARCVPGNAPHGSSITKKPSLSANNSIACWTAWRTGFLAQIPRWPLTSWKSFCKAIAGSWSVWTIRPTASARPTGALANCSPAPRRGWLPPAALAERIALLVEKDDYGVRHSLLEHVPQFLDSETIARLVDRWRKQAAQGPGSRRDRMPLRG